MAIIPNKDYGKVLKSLSEKSNMKRTPVCVLPHNLSVDSDVLCGDVCSVLDSMDAESVHCCITSPPYW